MMAKWLQRVSFFIVVSLVLNVIAALDAPPKLDPDTSSMNIETGSTLEVLCSGPYDLLWKSSSLASDVEERMDQVSTKDENTNTYENKLTVTDVNYADTGYFSCSYKGAPEGSLGNTSSIYVFVNDDEHLLTPLGLNLIIISPNKKNIIPCRPTNPDVKMTLYRGGELVSMNSGDIIFDNHIGYTILFVNIFYSGPVRCIAELNGKSDFAEPVLLWNGESGSLPPPSIDVNGYTHIMVRKRFVFTCLINVQDNTTLYVLDWDYPNKMSSKRVTIGETRKTVRMSKNAVSGSTIFYETVRNITVEDVEEKDEGVYTCTVRNREGKTDHAQTYVTVHGKNHTFLHLQADFHGEVLKLKAGEGARYVVQIDAQPGPAFLTWRKNNEKLYCPKKRPPRCEIESGNEKQSAIKLFEVSRNDTANYTLTVKMGDLEQSVTLELWVVDSPSVAIKNTFGYHLEKKRDEIICIVYALPKAEIFWNWSPCSTDGCNNVRHRLSSSLFDKPNRESVSEIDMGHYIRSTLSLTALKTGYYTCEAENELGRSSDDYLFIVTDMIVDSFPSGFGILPFNRYPLEKERVVMECGASKFNFTSRLSWKFDSTDGRWKNHTLTNETGLTITRTETNFTYGIIATFDSVQLKNSGWYRCEGITELHSVVKHAHRRMAVLAVEAPAVINTNMDGSVYLIERERSFQFVCNASGSPTPSVTWMKDNQTLNQFAQTQFNFIDNVILEIPRVVVEDTGMFFCVVSNREGSFTLNATLNVEAVVASSGMSPQVRGVVIAIVVIILLIIAILSAILARKCYIDRKEREEIYQLEKELFERGAIERYNPEIPLDEQIDILPYDKRWEFPQEKLKLGRTLGQGEFGRVVKAEAYGLLPEENCTIVAVKMLREHANIDQRKAIMQELKIMIHLGRHLNILNLLGACILNPRRGELLIIMEHCEYGCLRNYLLRNRLSFINQINPETGEIDAKFINAATNLSEPQSPTSPTYNGPVQDDYLVPLSPTRSYTGTGVTFTNDGADSSGDDSTGFGRQTASVKAKTPLTSCDLVSYAFQTARGMEYLAGRKLVHRDLALRNILLAKDNIIKICDFGLTKDCYNKAYYRKKGDTPLPVKWMALESIRDRIFSTESDVWSFGIILWELFSLGGNPYPGLDVDENFFKKLATGYRMDKPEYVTDEFYRIMQDCWHKEPQQRPTFTELTQWIGDQLQSGLRDHYIQLNTDYLRLYTPPEANPDYVNMNADPTPDYMNLPSRSSDMSVSEDEPISSKPDYLDMRGSNTPSMKNYQVARAAKNELKPMLSSMKNDARRKSEQNSASSPLAVKYSPATDRLTVPDNSDFKPPSYSTVMNDEFSV